MPKPGPEHAVFNMDIGTWDAVVEATQGARRAAGNVEGRRGEHVRLRRVVRPGHRHAAGASSQPSMTRLIARR
jgi:hypothetical protein